MSFVLNTLTRLGRPYLPLFTASLVVVGSCSGTFPLKPAKIVVSTEELDLGNGLPGEELSGTFEVANEGDLALTIYSLEASCGCSSAKISEQLIGPRSHARVTVTTRIKADSPVTRFRVSILSNDPVTPLSICTVQAKAGAMALRTEPLRSDP